MNTKIDIKSAILGLGMGVLVTLGIGATASSRDANGRYQIAGTGDRGLIIDTATGQVWTGYFPANEGKSDPDFLLPKLGVQK